MKILFIQTGGTIDKEYEQGAKAYSFIISTPAVERILSKAGPSFEYRVISVAKKDSMDLLETDRQAIVEACLNAPEKYIIITHGTDTMNDTAQALNAVKGKTIVITGALLPERFYNSDADFNIGTAVGAISALADGIYIAMSGMVMEWAKLQKDSTTGQFKPVAL